MAEEHPGSNGRRDHFGAAATATRDGVRATWMSLVGLALTAALQLVVVVLSGSVGHRLLAELSISVDREISVREGHTIAEQVCDALLHQVPRLADATVHVDPHEHASHLRRAAGGIDPLP